MRVCQLKIQAHWHQMVILIWRRQTQTVKEGNHRGPWIIFFYKEKFKWGTLFTESAKRIQNYKEKKKKKLQRAKTQFWNALPVYSE